MGSYQVAEAARLRENRSSAEQIRRGLKNPRLRQSPNIVSCASRAKVFDSSIQIADPPTSNGDRYHLCSIDDGGNFDSSNF